MSEFGDWDALSMALSESKRPISADGHVWALYNWEGKLLGRGVVHEVDADTIIFEDGLEVPASLVREAKREP